MNSVPFPKAAQSSYLRCGSEGDGAYWRALLSSMVGGLKKLRPLLIGRAQKGLGVAERGPRKGTEWISDSGADEDRQLSGGDPLSSAGGAGRRSVNSERRSQENGCAPWERRRGQRRKRMGDDRGQGSGATIRIWPG